LATTPSRADCGGTDLFPQLEIEAPSGFAAIKQRARSIPFGHGTLFRLSREGTSPSYLFGTLHVADPRVTNFSPEMRAALEHSKLVALETVATGNAIGDGAMTSDQRAEMRAALLAPKEQRPDHLLKSKDFASLEEAVVRRGLQKSAARKLKPTVLALLLDLPSCANGPQEGRPYADQRVADMARERAIPIISLETMIEQLDVLDGMPPNVERDLLIASLRQSDHARDVLETSITRYRKGDIGDLLSWMKSSEPIPGVAQAQIPAVFFDRLLAERTRRMRDRALPLLARGGAFIAVGAAHVPGADGLARLLEDVGYRIDVIQ
jgi:uncharacterized protein